MNATEKESALYISRQTKLIAKVRLPLYLPESLYNRLESLSRRDGLSMSAQVVRILREALK